MAYFDKILHYETDSGEWLTFALVVYELLGVEFYEIPSDEILSFLKRHHIFVANIFCPERVKYIKYIPAVDANMKKLDILISRQKKLFDIAANEFNSCNNLNNPESR